MSILRRKPRRPRRRWGPQLLDMRLKEGGGKSITHRVTLQPVAEEIPRVSVWAQAGSLGCSFLLEEDEARTLAKALLDAVEAAKALVAGGEGQ